MRRDYFICVCLTCIALSLIFICIAPADFSYGRIDVVSCSTFSFFLSLIFTIFILVVLPIWSAIKRKIWIMWGLVFYGFIVYIPLIVMPRIELIAQGKGSSTIFKIIYKVLDALYVVTNAPFAPLSKFCGSNFAFHLSTKIMPVALVIYFIFHLYRFYKKAYLAEKLNPLNQMDAVDKAKMRTVDEKPKEVIGTVVTAPDGNKKSIVQELFNVFDKDMRKSPQSNNSSSGDTKPLSASELHDMSEKYRRESIYTSEMQKQKLDNKFRAYIARYEKENNVKISADERKRLYSKFVKMYEKR